MYVLKFDRQINVVRLLRKQQYVINQLFDLFLLCTALVNYLKKRWENNNNSDIC